MSTVNVVSTARAANAADAVRAPRPGAGGWLSWHLHVPFAAAGRIDGLVAGPLAELVAALRADGAVDRWFFIRYWEGGPHLRLRLRPTGRCAPDVLDAAVRASFAGLAAAPDDPASVAAYLGRISRLARASGRADPSVDPALAGTVRAPGVHPAEYLPEYGRYGSGAALDAAEAVFEHSSDLAVRVARAAPDELRRRLVGLEAIAKLADGVARSGGDLDAQLARYAAYWRRWAGSVTPPVFDTAAAERTAARLAAALTGRGGVSVERLAARGSAVGAWSAAAVDSLCPHPPAGPGPLTREGLAVSQTHMTLNRLGILVHDEYMLITALRALRGADLAPGGRTDAPTR
ncbi:thiopeptide-type bacteriocin biosynthesis protein [Kitasatospora sp. NPDC088391]|uniref:thiopeptide-type bacteriocin biosynthesis protein n=1 Tax=Kitasatospora sp. NPDC088391 TaxID=3364074 RepID=UPI0037FF28A6